MNFFKVVQAQVQAQAQHAATLATDLATKASQDAQVALVNAKAFADTIASDAKGLATETQQKIAETQQKIINEYNASNTPKNVHADAGASTDMDAATAGVSQEVLDRAKALSYIDFCEHEIVTSKTEHTTHPAQLEAWQVKHAQCVLKVCKELQELRFLVTPKHMPETRFWQVYFKLIEPVISMDSIRESAQSGSLSLPRRESSHTLSTHGAVTPSNWCGTSGTSGWEDLGNDADQYSGLGAQDRATPSTPGNVSNDDLDAYLKVMLDDGDGTGAVQATDDAGDLDEYLEGLNSSAASSAGDALAAALEADEAGDLYDVPDSNLENLLGDVALEDASTAVKSPP